MHPSLLNPRYLLLKAKLRDDVNNQTNTEYAQNVNYAPHNSGQEEAWRNPYTGNGTDAAVTRKIELTRSTLTMAIAMTWQLPVSRTNCICIQAFIAVEPGGIRA